MAIILGKISLALETRRKSPIANHLDRMNSTAGALIEIEDLKKRYWSSKHRPVGPSNVYNCHGLTFAARRTEISDPAEIQKILSEDDYTDIPMNEVMPGDIVVYYKDGDIEHSGIVVQKEDLTLLVLSKWGSGHEVIHTVGDCPYDAHSLKYYRIIK